MEYDPLGGDVYVPGIDPDGTMSFTDARELDHAIDWWALNPEKTGVPFATEKIAWNFLPGQFTHNIEKSNLFVDIRGEDWIEPLLRETENYVKRDHPPQLVVFHVGGSIGYLHWVKAVHESIDHIRKEPRLGNIKFATRVAASWMPRYGQNPYIWRGATSDSLVTVDGKFVFPQSLLPTFKHRIWFLEELGFLKARASYVKTHTDQPDCGEGHRGSDFSFGEGGQKIDPWYARLYLRDDFPFRVGFPIRYLKKEYASLFGVPTASESPVVFGDPPSPVKPWTTYKGWELLKDPYRFIAKPNEVEDMNTRNEVEDMNTRNQLSHGRSSTGSI